MSWSNLKELIWQERKNLEITGPFEFPQESPFETQQSALLASYLKTKSHVDAVVSHFAETLEWPELSPLERYFVNARLEFAWEVVSIMNTARDGILPIEYPSAEKCRTSDLLEWLLVEIWPYGCGRFLQTQRSVGQPVLQARPTRNQERLERTATECVA